MIPSKKKKVHQRVHHYTLSTTEQVFSVREIFRSVIKSEFTFLEV